MNNSFYYIWINIVILICSINDCYGQRRRIADMLELPAHSNIYSYQEIYHMAYTVSFNFKHKIPNWVAWMLTRDNVSQKICHRTDNFSPDPKIEKNKCPNKESYMYSGYDRGHMCPAGDNTWSRVAMDECFYMSNICPQLHQLNAGLWETLEERCRKWAVQFGTIYIVCGPVFPKGSYKTIGDNITIPNMFFKAILRIEKNRYHIIGYLFSQDNYRKIVTIDEIEQLTGLNLFHKIDENVQIKIESQIDCTGWPYFDR